jgi:hypothetical protein
MRTPKRKMRGFPRDSRRLMEKYIEITDDDLNEVAEPVRRWVSDIFNQFMKTVKAKLVYPASSRLPAQFGEELFTAMTSLLDEIDEISFRIEADAILFHDNEVYRARDKSDNFAHPFFRDGVINFSFKKGITAEELDEFVDVSARMMRSALIDDDLTTLLWEAGFEHISYELMDDFIDIEAIEYGTDKLKTGKSPSKDDMSQLFQNEIDINLTEEDFDLESEKNKAAAGPKPYSNAEEKVADFVRNVLTFTEEEKAAIAENLKADEYFVPQKYAIDVCFEILGQETDNAGYDETLNLIAKVNGDFIRSGDFKTAASILERAIELREVLKNLNDPKKERINSLIESLAGSEKIRILVDTLNKANDINYTEVSDYLKMLPWQAVDHLVWALGELDHYPARRAVCQALEVIAVDHVELLGKGTDSPRWYVVRNVVSLLGKIKNPRALNFLKRTIRHPDIRVRKETVLSAASIDSDEAADFLIAALNDADEKVQTMALNVLVSKNVERAFEAINRIVSDKNFKNRSPEQIREILEGYAILGKQRAFEPLKNIIKQRTFLASEKEKRLKNYAVRALSHVPTRGAINMLDKISQSKNKTLADSARRAIIRRKKGNALV